MRHPRNSEGPGEFCSEWRGRPAHEASRAKAGRQSAEKFRVEEPNSSEAPAKSGHVVGTEFARHGQRAPRDSSEQLIVPVANLAKGPRHTGEAPGRQPIELDAHLNCNLVEKGTRPVAGAGERPSHHGQVHETAPQRCTPRLALHRLPEARSGRFLHETKFCERPARLGDVGRAEVPGPARPHTGQREHQARVAPHELRSRISNHGHPSRLEAVHASQEAILQCSPSG
mmetsp:Transcript_57686/g.160786  ORF Transcript_57686/g.160786 Transcript_57686/m.160786 type:complete len:228 (-) Transcript_57686:474-1157(-)